MLAYDDKGATEAITVDVYNRAITETLAPALQAHGERWARTGTVAITKVDRTRYLYTIVAGTLAPGHNPLVSSVTNPVRYMFGLPSGATGVVRRIWCRDGDGDAGILIKAGMNSALGVFSAAFANLPASPPFDLTGQNDTITSTGFISCEVVNGGGTIQDRNYQVIFEMLLDFQAGTS